MREAHLRPAALVDPGRPGTPTVADVEAELSRASWLRLRFRAQIEARYEADTRDARAWNIRLTVPMGLVAYFAFTFVDAAILPDLGWIPMLLRLFVITPVGLFAMWMATRASAAFREAFISYAITATMMFPVAFIAVSEATFAPYTMLVVLLVSMFGNITMRLRFHWACLFTLMTVLTVGGMLCVRSDLAGGLAGAILIATITCVSFGIVANNQLERAERRSYLLALREMLRSEQLSMDRAALSALSLVDPLTGLANRRAFDARLAQLWHLHLAQARPFCLLMIDVDHFKRFNDHYGHLAGDSCLVGVAEVLRSTVARRGDLVARYGGEEFAVLLADCTIGEAVRTAHGLCRGLAVAGIAHVARTDAERVVTVSVGAGCSLDVRTPSDLIAAADRDLYAAKRAGRNRVGALVPVVAAAG